MDATDLYEAVERQEAIASAEVAAEPDFAWDFQFRKVVEKALRIPGPHVRSLQKLYERWMQPRTCPLGVVGVDGPPGMSVVGSMGDDEVVQRGAPLIVEVIITCLEEDPRSSFAIEQWSRR